MPRPWPKPITGVDAKNRNDEKEAVTDDHMFNDDELQFEDDDDSDIDCGLMPDGQCQQAGTEHCDFCCPNRMSELFAGSPAWRAKHSRKDKSK